jgi:hypothetical protein
LPKKSSKVAKIAYTMKGCLRFYKFMFLILPNLIKYTSGLLPLEQHDQIEKITLGEIKQYHIFKNFFICFQLLENYSPIKFRINKIYIRKIKFKIIPIF